MAMKEDLFLTGILDEDEVSNQSTTLEECKRVFRTVHLNTLYEPFLKHLEKYEPDYQNKVGKLF